MAITTQWLLILGWFFLLIVLERAKPLRPLTYSFKKHSALNVGYFLLSAPFNRLMSLFFLSSIASQPSLFSLPTFAGRSFFILILLDLILYYWHRLNHEVPFLWRFHKFHHADREMDATTALRFHLGEFFFSALFKAMIIFVLGIKVYEYVQFEIFVTTAALFHHSNIKLPSAFEKFVSLLIVTPNFHHAHHSEVKHETNSNYSTVFNVWDKLHRTYTKKATGEITIGLDNIPVTPSFLDGLKLPWKN